mmetsp:Transcript_56206/g.131622  ORF Transcript_56206/g.131622 Transcript_56206/m.131622 type:complete len:238 (+) Transcript_56206:79-792(+)
MPSLMAQVDAVRHSSAGTMEFHMPTANNVARSYMCQQKSALGNTFINLCVPDSRVLRRSASAPGPLADSVDLDPTEPWQKTEDERRVDSTQNSSHRVAQDKACGDDCSPERGSGKIQNVPDFTTVMLRNLPMGLDQAGVHMVLKGAGYHGAYNYLYVPARFHDGTCLGYAFINFIAPSVAAAFLRLWSGSAIFCDRLHRKPLVVEIAGVQGVAALLTRNGKRQARNPRFRPYIVSSQ